MNKYMEQQAPWKVAKTDLKRAGTILYTATEGLRICACHLAPVMPARTATVLDILDDQERSTEWGGLKSGVTLSAHEALFPRLELPEN